jgi:hypothetical protein
MNRIWRVAGALLLAHVVLLLAGYSQQRSPNFGDSPQSMVSTYNQVEDSKMYLGIFIVTISWLVLLAALTLLAGLLRSGGNQSGADMSRGFAGLVATAATAATVVTIGGAYATAGGAIYAASHGFSPEIVASITTVSKFADLIAMSAAGLAALAVGVAGLVSRVLPAWVAWVSVAVGVVGIASGVNSSVLNTGNAVWLLWLIVLGIVLLRGRSRRLAAVSEPAATAAALS